MSSERILKCEPFKWKLLQVDWFWKALHMQHAISYTYLPDPTRQQLASIGSREMNEWFKIEKKI